MSDSGVYYGFWPVGTDYRMLCAPIVTLASMTLMRGERFGVEVHQPGSHGCDDPMRQRGEIHWNIPPLDGQTVYEAL